MANLLRIYRRVYHITVGSDGSSSYELMDPLSITAIVHNRATSSVVESPASVVYESIGNYYVDLVPSLYNGTDIYEIEWTLQYVTGSPSRQLFTQFMLPLNLTPSGSVVIRELGIELANPHPIEIEVQHRPLEITVMRN